MGQKEVIKTNSAPRASGCPRWLSRSISCLGLLVVFACPAGAAGRRLVSPNQPNRPSPEQPWTEAGGSLPPLPPARSEAPFAPWDVPSRDSETAFPPKLEESVRNSHDEARGRTHPAIHPRDPKSDRERITPLFSKAGAKSTEKSAARAEKERTERRACMARHPAGRDLRAQVPGVKTYVVKPGDTLWGIAEKILDSGDVRTIARYWPRIHRANRGALGADPNRLMPGQVLLLPATPGNGN